MSISIVKEIALRMKDPSHVQKQLFSSPLQMNPTEFLERSLIWQISSFCIALERLKTSRVSPMQLAETMRTVKKENLRVHCIQKKWQYYS